jgi:mono/diheme cytochrome c family protein
MTESMTEGGPATMTARLRVLARVSVIVAGVAGAAALHAQVPAQVPTAGLPHSAGADVAAAKCLGCHQADLIVSQRLSPTGWDREVAKMERWGTQLSPEERPVLVRYLAREFGVRPTASHDATAVTAGEAVFTGACRVCHDDDLSEQQRLTAAGWGREVDKMVRWGAKVTADERPALVAYLTSRWGQP